MQATAPLDTDVAIETPEHIVFHHRVAGPARRALAYVLDLFLCYLAVALLALVILFVAAGASGTGAAAESLGKSGIGLILLVLFFVQWIYFVVWEGTGGRTPGKIALGCRVVTTRAQPVGLVAASLRNVLRAADILPIAYLVGLVSMMLTRRFQRLGDLVAGTMVVLDGRASAASPLRLFPPAQPRELAELPDEVVLDAEERNALELFLRRRGRLGLAREQELALMIAPGLAARLGVPPPRDPARMLALIYDRAVNAGRVEAPPSSRSPGSWR